MAEKKKTERQNLRAMPSNLEAEQNVLGARLIDDNVKDSIMPMLNPEDFFAHQNRIIFSAMSELAQHNHPIDTVSVADKLEIQYDLSDVFAYTRDGGKLMLYAFNEHARDGSAGQ